MLRLDSRRLSLVGGISSESCKKAPETAFQLLQPSPTDCKRLGERLADHQHQTKARGVPTIEQYSVRVPSPSTEEVQQ